MRVGARSHGRETVRHRARLSDMATTPKRAVRIADDLWQKVESYGASELITASDVVRVALEQFFGDGQPEPVVSDTRPTVGQPVSDTRAGGWVKPTGNFSKAAQASGKRLKD